MHDLGLMGAPRRYHEMGEAGFVSPSADMLNVFITVTALVVGVVQFLFLFNLVWSLFKRREASGTPSRAKMLAWKTPDTPPPLGTWGYDMPVVQRGAYAYSGPGPATTDTQRKGQESDR